MVAEIWASVMSSFVDQLVALKQGLIGVTKQQKTLFIIEYNI